MPRVTSRGFNEMYFVYMIRNADDKLYIGISVAPEKRLLTHNAKRGANFTKTFHKFELVFKEPHATMGEARQRENQIKKWRRDKKERLIKRYSQGLPTRQI